MTTKQAVLSEHDEQVHVIDWCELMSSRHPELKLLFAVPNGGNRNIVTAVKLKAEGVKAGVPDLFLPVPRDERPYPEYNGIFRDCLNVANGLFIEMKKRKGSTTSKEQKWWHEKLREQGYKVVIAKGADEAIECIADYLGIEVGR